MKWFLKAMSQYFDFSSRARRTEYWMFLLFNTIFAFCAIFLDNLFGIANPLTGYGVFYLLYSLAVFVPGLAVTVRRLHDIDKSGWMLLILLIPLIGIIWFLVLLFTSGTKGVNSYGEDPKDYVFHKLKNRKKKNSSSNRNIKVLEQIRNEITVKEKKSLMHDMILMSPHDDSKQDVNPNGIGKFGLEKTNPIPIYGIDNIPTYMDKLRYKYVSKSGSNSITYNHIDFIRTSESDNSENGSKKPEVELPTSSTTADNISGHIDVYNIYTIGGEKIAKIYVNCYSLITSNKVPDDFYHRDDIPAVKDSKVLMEAMKNLK